MTILGGFVLPEVLSDEYNFSPSGIYKSIKPADQGAYIKYIDSWPLNTSPELFGLHDNADITCARNETFDTLASIVTFEGSAGGGGGAAGGKAVKTPDDIVTELAMSILQKIRGEFDIPTFQTKYPTKYEDSMNTVLVQEAIRFNGLITVLRSTLQNVISAIKGLVVMSKELDELYRAMLINRVPTMWEEVAYPSLKPLAGWVTDLAQRLSMIERWYEQGHPRCYWISGFFFPQAFMTGILQNYARKDSISIDTISYSFEWLAKNPEEVKQPPPSGCYIYGMYMEGARIDPATLQMAESKPKVLFEASPMLWLIPTVNRVKPTSGVYRCPLYKTLRRAGTLSTTGHSTNYVLTVEIPTPHQTPEHWIKRGTALVCALNY